MGEDWKKRAEQAEARLAKTLAEVEDLAGALTKLLGRIAKAQQLAREMKQAAAERDVCEVCRVCLEPAPRRCEKHWRE